MKKSRRIAIFLTIGVLLLCLFLMSACNNTSQYKGTALETRDTDELYVMSYNIRTWMPFTNKEDRWSYRKDALVGHILSYAPDLIGVQEVRNGQAKYLNRNLDGYDYVGRGRGMISAFSEGAYIFYRTDRLELIENGHFWMSETPEKNSKGWDTSVKRITVWAVFKDLRTGKTFMHFNTHLDHKGPEAREKSSELLVERMLESEYPAILTGDFNFNEQHDNYKNILSVALEDSKYIADVDDDGLTFHDYGEREEEGVIGSPIDYCMLSPGDFRVSSYRILAEKFDDIYTSDHYAILIKLQLK